MIVASPTLTPPAVPPDELAKEFIKVVLGALRLKPAQRRRAIYAWCDRRGLGTGSTGSWNDTARMIVAKIATKLRVPLKLSRFRLVARVLFILVISYVDIITGV